MGVTCKRLIIALAATAVGSISLAFVAAKPSVINTAPTLLTKLMLVSLVIVCSAECYL